MDGWMDAGVWYLGREKPRDGERRNISQKQDLDTGKGQSLLGLGCTLSTKVAPLNRIWEWSAPGPSQKGL